MSSDIEREASMQDEDRKDGKKAVEKDPMPAAGPHAKKELTNSDATPGTGALPDPDEDEIGGGAS
jgi:hypothetical protein